MTHKEFTERLCAVVNKLCLEFNGEEAPCFCGENKISKIEIDKDTWNINPTIIEQIEDLLN
jgi:hypothetical protein